MTGVFDGDAPLAENTQHRGDMEGVGCPGGDKNIASLGNNTPAAVISLPQPEFHCACKIVRITIVSSEDKSAIAQNSWSKPLDVDNSNGLQYFYCGWCS